MTTAAIKFTQGVSSGQPGQSVYGSAGTSVTVSSAGDNSGVVRAVFTLLWAPPGSSLSARVLQDTSGSGLLLSCTFTPDTTDCFVLKLDLYDQFNVVYEDVRIFGVKRTNGRLLPGFTTDPDQWNFSDNLNFDGSSLGFAPYANAFLEEADSSTSGWTTAYDRDLTTLPNQTIGSDGAVTLDGMQWTKFNSGSEDSPMAIVHGTGLVINPSAGTDLYHSGSQNCPGIFLPFAQIASMAGKFDWTTRFRMWMRVSAFSNSSSSFAQGDFTSISMDMAAGGVQQACSMALMRGWQYSSNNAGMQMRPMFKNDNAGSVTDLSVVGLVTANSVVMFDWSPGDAFAKGFCGGWSGAWPSIAAMRILNPAVYTTGAMNFGDNEAAVSNIAGAGVTITAQHSTSDGHDVSATISNLRVDYEI